MIGSRGLKVLVARRRTRALAAGLAIATAAAGITAASGQHGGPTPPGGSFLSGGVIFGKNCAMCHTATGASGGVARAPKIETIREYAPERIVEALTTGKMQSQGSMLSRQEKRQVAEFVAGRAFGSVPQVDPAAMPNQCHDAPAMTNQESWNGWGRAADNDRFTTSATAGLSAADLPNLKLKWAFGFPGGAQVASQPTVIGGWLFVGSDSGHVYALDAVSGCIHWTFKAGATVRTAPLIAPLRGASGERALFFGDLQGRLYAVSLKDGHQIWSQQIDARPQIRVQASPVVFNGLVFVGVSSGEEGALFQPGYECCRFRGSISALDAATGRRVWQTYIVDEPQRLPIGADGRQRWGPSGGGVWSTPTIDPKRKRIYIGTGNAYTGAASDLNDSVVALDMATGAVIWHRQDTRNDVWLFGCKVGMAGCAAHVGPDADFSASVILKTLTNGHDVLVASHKGGVAMALDPDARGKLIWRTPLAAKDPSEYGDILFGGAADQRNVYFALQETAAMVALDLGNGRVMWKESVVPIAGRANRIGAGSAVTGLPGAVLSGGWDGVLRAYDITNGKPIWSFDTAKPFETINKVSAKGGSMGGPGAAVAGGMLYIGSGYVGVSNGMPGNVLLAFSK